MLGFLLVAGATPEMGENRDWGGDLPTYAVSGGGGDPCYWNGSRSLVFLCHSALVSRQTPQ